MNEVEVKNQFVIGHNPQYTFGVGQVGELWVGFAAAPGMVFVFSQISEKGQLGVKDRDKAILLTSALACDIEGSYGGIDVWNIPQSLRGDPEQLRCKECQEIGCENGCSKYGDDDDSDIPLDEETPDLGPCCACEKVSDSVRNIIMLPFKSPSREGWGCFQCDLPGEGASAVVCDECRENKVPIKFATEGYLRDKKRIPIESLTGTHDHDMSKH